MEGPKVETDDEMHLSTRGSMQQSTKISRLANDERFRNLVRRRSRFSWLLTATILVIYFGYIMLIAFRRDVLAAPFGRGTRWAFLSALACSSPGFLKMLPKKADFPRQGAKGPR